VPPDALVATVDGRKVTASELQAILRVLPPQTRQQAMKNAAAFLQQYGMLRKLSAMAEQAGLDKGSPLKEQLEYNRMVGLAQAQLMNASNAVTVPPEEAQSYYESNHPRFQQAKVKAIYIPFSANGPAKQDSSDKKALSETEAKAKADKLLAEIRAGADFVKLVKEHSGDPVSAAKDGDFGAIRRSDKLPEPVKNAIFSLKPGEVSEPVRQPNGFYLFRVEEIGTQPFDEVKGQIMTELKQAKFTQWVQKTQNSVDVKIESQAFFEQAPAGVSAPTPAK